MGISITSPPLLLGSWITVGKGAERVRSGGRLYCKVVSCTQQGSYTLEPTAVWWHAQELGEPKEDKIPAWRGEVGLKSHSLLAIYRQLTDTEGGSVCACSSVRPRIQECMSHTSQTTGFKGRGCQAGWVGKQGRSCKDSGGRKGWI